MIKGGRGCEKSSISTMESTPVEEKIGWKIVTNNVEERLSSCSPLHNLMPHRKLRRRTKVLNATLKRMRYTGIRSYSRYVKIKTSVLRNITEDCETDDSDVLSEEDYSALHKHNFIKTENNDKQSEEEMDLVCSEEWNTTMTSVPESAPAKKKVTRRKSVPKKPRIPNLGWQSVIKRSVENTNYTLNNSGSSGITGDAEKHVPKATGSIRPRKFSVETPNPSCGEKFTKRLQKSLVRWQKPSVYHENHDDPNPLPTEIPISNERCIEENKKSMKESKANTSSNEKQLKNSSRNEDIKVEGVKKNLAKIFAQHSENERETHIFVDNNKDKSDKLLTGQESSLVSPAQASTVDSNPSPQKSESVNGEAAQSVNQPKDSGIDDDSQEELSEDGKDSERKVSEEITENENHYPPKLSVDKPKDQDEEEVPPNSQGSTQPWEQNILSQKYHTPPESTSQLDISIRNELETWSVFNVSDISIAENEKAEPLKSKQHPKVMCTEIVNQKFKIVSENYQNESKSTHKEQNESELDQSCAESVDKANDDKGSACANDTIDRGFTLHLDSSDMECRNEESFTEMKEVIAESSVIDKNHILANSTEIPKCDSDSEDESDKSECADGKTRHKYKFANERNDITRVKEDDFTCDVNNSAHADSTNGTVIKQESDSVKNITEAEDSINISSRSQNLPEFEHSQEEENSPSLNQSKIRIPSMPENIVQEDIVELEDSQLSEEGDENTENSMSAFSKKRLQQLKRLNLIVGSESSSEEDESGNRTTHHWRDKFKVEKKDTAFSSERTEKKKTKLEKKQASACKVSANPYLSDSDEHDESAEAISSTVTTLEKKQTEKPRINDSTNNVTNENESTPKSCKTSLTRTSENEECAPVHERISEIGEISFPVALDTSTPSTTSKKANPIRPKKLQDLIEEQHLVEDTNDAGFSFKDLGDDDIYLVDIPKSVSAMDLLGEKFVLKGKKLKLGGQKYRASYKEVDTVSCFIATGKSRKPYKIVNVKPVAAVVAQAKSPKLALMNNVNQETEISEAEVTPQSVMKVPGKRKRRRPENNILEEDVVKGGMKRFKFCSNTEDNST